MTEREIYDGVIVNGTTNFIFVAETLRRRGARWYVIDGMAVNSYVKPAYTADLDLVVISADLEPVLADLRAADFRVKEFPFSTNAQQRAGQTEISAYMLMVRFTKPGCYQPFVERASLRPIFGVDVPVASLADVVQGKLWVWNDPSRGPGKHLKDQFDLLRLAEERFDEVVPLLPDELRAAAESDRARRLETGDNGWGDDDRGEP